MEPLVRQLPLFALDRQALLELDDVSARLERGEALLRRERELLRHARRGPMELAPSPGTDTRPGLAGDLLVLRPGALGDTLLALPALRALRRHRRPGRLVLAAHGPTAAWLESVGEVERGVPFDDPSLAWLFDERSTPPTPVPAAIVAWLADGQGRLARAARAAGCEDVLVAPSRAAEGQAVHCARHLVQTLAPWGTPRRFDAARVRIAPACADDVLVHPGSGSARKNWPPERLAACVDQLTRRGASVRLVVGEADALAAAAVERALGHALPRLEHPSLSELAARLAGCRAYLGNDSGVSHLAGWVGARAVVLFGPTSPAVWQPLGPRVTVLSFGAQPAAVAEALLGVER